jgi:hypothetical protein
MSRRELKNAKGIITSILVFLATSHQPSAITCKLSTLYSNKQASLDSSSFQAFYFHPPCRYDTRYEAAFVEKHERWRERLGREILWSMRTSTVAGDFGILARLALRRLQHHFMAQSGFILGMTCSRDPLSAFTK